MKIKFVARRRDLKSGESLLNVEIVLQELLEPGLEEIKLMPKPRRGASYLVGTIGDAETVRERVGSEDDTEIPMTSASRLAYLDKVFVEIGLWGQGIGTALVGRFIEIACSKKVDAIYLKVNNEDEVADEVWASQGRTDKQFRRVPWFRRFGFECLEGEDPHYSPIMVLILNGGEA